MKKSKKQFIEYNHSLIDYKKRYKRHLNSLLFYTDKEVNDFDKKYNTNKQLLKKRHWWHIQGSYYEAPKSIFFNKIKHLKVGYKIAIGTVILGLLGFKTYHSIRMLQPYYSVSFVGEQKDTHLVMVGNNTAKRGEDYKVKFNIDYMYELSHENIHVYIDGRERSDCWTFIYQTNVKNELTVKKEYIHGDITIKANAHYRTIPSFVYGVENDDYVENNLDVKVYAGDNKTQVFKEPIPQLHGTYAYPVHEDDILYVEFTIKESASITTIDDNLWFRTNARFAKEKSQGEDYDFIKTTSEGGKHVEFYVPHFIIRDNCDLRIKP